ncbi:UDP-N-acetylglucosamine 1-carboxyvinyltransferase [Propionibacterium sp. oral taxon 192 str. F0372]|uniref:helix-turn-helix domain-containing protein n=1 Tax=Propionibacterium sp. oral taxon 192 TaxID=671222 RepID=UPI0003529E30|nr:UDP-N-acetylglucosamine 1-carboxyvinyltransferase [Propionibacterium sp. oral taxon 192]EPH02814.1 UDP-N-acetylglucosamine 1-carboxyvinyltransferase [Propionibacterium sp. oral taxon 192 str. F0372]
MTDTPTPQSVGRLIRDARKHRGLTQNELASLLNTSQSAITRIEAGNQNLSLEMISRIAEVLESRLIAPGDRPVTPNLLIEGETSLSGSIETRSSKNAAVALLCASLLNRGRTVLRGIAHIEEVNRLLEVLESIGVEVSWSEDGRDLTLQRPQHLLLDDMNIAAARRTRSVIMFLGPLMHLQDTFRLPYAGGCDLGARTVEPHLQALRRFGLEVEATDGFYRAHTCDVGDQQRTIVLTERGDTVTENALMAAAMTQGVTTIRNASPNYMVQDLCVYLQMCGVQIDGVGSTTLVVHGRHEISADVTYTISEDPIEAMSLITAAVVTHSELTITRAPIEFLEIELALLAEMGLKFTVGGEYASGNDFTRLVNITVHPSDLHAHQDKIHPLPFPGLNIDNLPFFALIAACANGRTMIHDWVYENRAIHLLELSKLGANVQLLDPHRLNVTGPTRWRARELFSPPALRPAVCIMLAMLAARGDSMLRDTYVINRGYEDLATRLNKLGAKITTFAE